ncbi:MAG: chromosome segregation protein SMC [Microcystaceae cyanobacterium]
MVHIKRIELSNFKSFGGTTEVPFLTGFTVVSGPNGSGKSNILDALLFCLGLATSKGMRAERLPDLINHSHSNNRKTKEASVSVTFDISDLEDLSTKSQLINQKIIENQPHNSNGNGHHSAEEEKDVTHDFNPLITQEEWTVTRRLRVTKGGSYSSTYYMNGQPCNATELHEQLNRLRIYPEGYNVVLQGDVTRIINMNSKERRNIIDELAGVAEFDRKIEKTKATLEEVREREERCQIIETELQRNLERLAADRAKAEKYQKLKTKIQEKRQWEKVLAFKLLQQQEEGLKQKIEQGEKKLEGLIQCIQQLSATIHQKNEELDKLNQQVKALGEDEQLAVASQLATQKAKRHQLQQRQTEWEQQLKQIQQQITQTQQEIQQQEGNLSQLNQRLIDLQENRLPFLTEQRDNAQNTLEMVRQQAAMLAEASDAWVQEQTALSRKISQLQNQLNPQRTEYARLSERQQQLDNSLTEQEERLQITEDELKTAETERETLSHQVNTSRETIQTLVEQYSHAENARATLKETQDRLLGEQREKQRQLDKLEATKQAQQEAQGTYATQLILNSDLSGVCGLVAQLGQVNPRYQLALEIAAGGRLAQIVVEDDTIAAAGIKILKHAKAGRATFLPLNKIRPPRSQSMNHLRNAAGFIDLAVNLVICQNQYKDVFGYVFGNTVIFENLNDARNYLGQNRIVTLDGDLLETSGAMTGGSRPKRSNIRFGVVKMGESEEVKTLKTRLGDIEQMLSRNEELLLKKEVQVKELSHQLTEIRQNGREQELNLQQLDKEIQRLNQQKIQFQNLITKGTQELETIEQQLHTLNKQLPFLESDLEKEQQRLTQLEQSHSRSEWQQMQTLIKTQEKELQNRENTLRQGENEANETKTQLQRVEDKLKELNQRLVEYNTTIKTVNQQQTEGETQLTEIDQQIKTTEAQLEELSQQLGETKKERDRLETELRNLQNSQQEKNWQQEKLQTTQQERNETLTTLQEQLEQQQTELPQPCPEIPLLNQEITDFKPHLSDLQQELERMQKRLEAMEPVNMLALEEYEKTQERLQELSDKLKTIEAERTELLLRIENFTTLRFRAFKEAFDAVNENFKTIFETLSQGDGYLQLDNPDDPFSGGLTLVAHPKGKPVQRLSSMSGGEKSLTALSFIFSLQRYRPSPFYAFDEVDMFLDGANVERLSKMIRQQAEQAQFIVVSLRRPMIEASQRTIGVTQARGAHTQVLGIKL